MKFGAIPLDQAEGAILAHSIRAEGVALKKGLVLNKDAISRLAAAGVREVVAARLDPDDAPEDDAAQALARAAAGEGLRLAAPFTGRCNLHAEAAGVLRVDAAAVTAANVVDEALTLATPPDYSRLEARRMAATAKVIPYGAPRAAVAAVCALLERGPALRLHPFLPLRAALVVTRTPGQKDSVVEKGAKAVRDRLRALGSPPPRVTVVPHEEAAVGAALSQAAQDEPELVLVLGGSATSDRRDVIPAAVIAQGGRIERFGMPVDPGNLLALGSLGAAPLVVLPGCARSPKLNGADWVLERLAARLPVSGADIAAMGVGGLLKEIPSRPQPRESLRPAVVALVLAAGASSRMRGGDKLLEPVAGAPVLRHVVEAALEGGADEAVVVLGANAPARRAALAGLGARIVENPDWREGMAASIRAGVAALDASVDAAMILPADMPEIDPDVVARVLAGFSPEDGRAIVRPRSESGRVGHPALFARRFFPALSALRGDVGARAVIKANTECVADVAVAGEAVALDLDTPEDWAEWRAKRG